MAGPMIVSNISIPLVSLVDSAVAGHLPHAFQLAAVAAGGSLYTLLAWAGGFLRMGTTGFIAQAAGARDDAAIRRVLAQALLLGLAFSLLLILITLPGLPLALHLMQPSAELGALAREYVHIRLLGLPAALASYALIGWFLGMQDARTALYLMLTTNLVNIALNLLFVPLLGFGVPGVAAASVCGEWAGAALGLVLAARTLRSRPGDLHWSRLIRRADWTAILTVNRDIFIRTLALQVVFFSITVFGTRLGDVTVAANALLLNGLLVVSYALDGFAHAVEALCGRAIGARDRAGLERALTVAGGWSLLLSIGFAIAFLVGGDLFVDVQTDITAVRMLAYQHLPYLALLPLIAVWSYLLDGLFIGATEARAMRNSMLAATATYLPLVWALTRALGNHGLWLAFLVFMLVRGIYLGALTPRIFARVRA